MDNLRDKWSFKSLTIFLTLMWTEKHVHASLIVL